MSLKKNVLANYLGQGWRTIMSLAFVPLYIKYLGIEAYGLIGIFVMLQTWLGLIDVGMKPALEREMARYTGGEHNAQSIWDLLRSIEVLTIFMAVLVSAGIWLLSSSLATDWVQAEKIPVDVVTIAFTLMGMVIALRFVENIYTNCIAGLQLQVLQNVVTSIMATFRGLGAVAVLAWVSPTIEAFFILQGLVSLVTALIFMIIVYRVMPQSERSARFSVPALRKIWRFAAGMFGITFLAILLTQVDKILLSRLLSLESFGYYVMAGLVSGGLYMMVAPVTAAFYPRFAELHSRRNFRELSEYYHLASQMVTVLMGSAAVILIVFAERVLLLWTNDPVLTEQVTTILVILAFGTFLNGLMWVPYQMQLAHGWTSLSIKINLVAVMLLVPSIIWVVPNFGAVGAAWVWVLLNAGYCFIGVHFMYQRILTSEKWTWYFNDILIPVSAALTVSLSANWILPDDFTRLGELFVILGSSLVTLIVATLFAPRVRSKAIGFIPGWSA